MSLLAGTLYDPTGGAAVSKVTSAALAMTALDTTNLRLNFTVPANGKVLVRQAGVVNGAATFPSILIGVLEGATLRGRVAPQAVLSGTALATTNMPFEAMWVVTGLTSGNSLTWDAAYGVEFAVTSSAIKYGGPNNTTASDAFGGYAFEIYDTA